MDGFLSEQAAQGIERMHRIKELKSLLRDTDYIAAKIAEGAAEKEEYTEQMAQRQSWRNEINELEGSL